MPSRQGVHPALQGPPLGFAHRGFTPPATGRRPHAWENTVAAFAAARAQGLRHLETDARATADGVCVLLHDPDLDRTTDGTGAVAELPWSVVAKARVDGRHPVPRLDDVLDRYTTCVLNIDCKDDRAVEPLAAAIERARAADRVVVASFDDRRSAAVAARVPGVARSLGMAGTLAARLAAGLASASSSMARDLLRRVTASVDALQVPEQVGPTRVLTPRLVELAHEVGVQVHVWTVDDEERMRQLLALGVDGIMSDRADVLAHVLAGQLPS